MKKPLKIALAGLACCVIFIAVRPASTSALSPDGRCVAQAQSNSAFVRLLKRGSVAISLREVASGREVTVHREELGMWDKDSVEEVLWRSNSQSFACVLQDSMGVGCFALAFDLSPHGLGATESRENRWTERC